MLQKTFRDELKSRVRPFRKGVRKASLEARLANDEQEGHRDVWWKARKSENIPARS